MTDRDTPVTALESRFWSKVDRRGPDECWPWLGSRRSVDDRYGYGMFWSGTRIRPAGQVVWEIANGQPFPADRMACHSCDNPPCVNPAHIFVGTMSENILDSVAKGRSANDTHCKRGHEFTEANTYRGRDGWRRCRICMNRPRIRPGV